MESVFQAIVLVLQLYLSNMICFGVMFRIIMLTEICTNKGKFLSLMCSQ